MKKLLILILALFIMHSGQTQTNVSGGIYSNTTWTFALSPYVVTGTVVVFPGFILTIEPGVIVKFADNQQLEIRQSTLIAEGTSNDSIIFTSNTTNPSYGQWNNIYLNGSHTSRFNYCSFSFAEEGINANMPDSDTLILKNSNSYYNTYGFVFSGKCFVDSCNVFGNKWGFAKCANGCKLNFCRVINNKYNGISVLGPNVTITNCYVGCNGQYGIYCGSGYNSLVQFCNIEYNQHDGIIAQGSIKAFNCSFRYNRIGFEMGSWGDTVVQCLFQNNYKGVSIFNGYDGQVKNNVFQDDTINLTINNPANEISCNSFSGCISYHVKYTAVSNSDCIIHNYWGTADSATIVSLIYDGYDTTAYGLLTFSPFYTVACSNTGPTTFSTPSGCSLNPVQINEVALKGIKVSIYPNPASDRIFIDHPENQALNLTIYDFAGKTVLNKVLVNKKDEIDIGFLSNGIYIIQVSNDQLIQQKKMIKE